MTIQSIIIKHNMTFYKRNIPLHLLWKLPLLTPKSNTSYMNTEHFSFIYFMPSAAKPL